MNRCLKKIKVNLSSHLYLDSLQKVKKREIKFQNRKVYFICNIGTV